MSKLIPNEEKVAVTGEGRGIGMDFRAFDRDFQASISKARRVLDGADHFSFAEIEKLLARMLVDG